MGKQKISASLLLRRYDNLRKSGFTHKEALNFMRKLGATKYKSFKIMQKWLR